MTGSTVPQRGSLRLVLFCTFHALVVSAGAGWTSYRLRAIRAERAMPPLRNEPLQVGPLYDNSEIVSDEQLRTVLQKLKPRFRYKRPKINYVDHALRLWGAEAVFDDPDCLSGVEMREILLDHRRFARAWGSETRPFLIDETPGVRMRTQQGRATASHVDHTLACLAEVGTPLDYPVITPQRQTVLRAAVEQSLRDFNLNQTEYEWSALVYALYLPPADHFYTTDGQRISFDLLARRIMRQRLRQGVCRGNHRLHALVMLLRVDEQEPILSPATRQQVVSYLQDVTRRFVESQHENGYWESDWPGPEWDGRQREYNSSLDPLATRLLVTGHVMEWWALAPPDVQPPPDVVVKAGQWLCHTIEALSDRRVRSNYTFLSHAGRALALWRGRRPAEVNWPRSRL